VTEAEWLNCTRPGVMLRFLRGKSTDRKLRLFACACCRRVWDLLTAEEDRHAIEMAERFTDGLGSDEELATAERKATRPARDAASRHVSNFPSAAAKAAARLVGNKAYSRVYAAYTGQTTSDAPLQVARELGVSAEAAKDPRDAYIEAEAHEAAIQTDLLRDVFGPLPFRLVTIDPTWLAWNDGLVVRLAQAAYQERNMPEGALDKSLLAILADALEEAGCTDTDILGHLRGPGPHVLGCWPVDLCLGKS
jgi:hypothetical protein